MFVLPYDSHTLHVTVVGGKPVLYVPSASWDNNSLCWLGDDPSSKILFTQWAGLEFYFCILLYISRWPGWPFCFSASQVIECVYQKLVVRPRIMKKWAPRNQMSCFTLFELRSQQQTHPFLESGVSYHCSGNLSGHRSSNLPMILPFHEMFLISRGWQSLI